MNRSLLIAMLPLVAACDNSWQRIDPNAGSQPTGGFARAPLYAGPSLDSSPPPISGGTLSVLSVGNVAVASDPDRDTVSIVDLTTQTVRSTLTLNEHDEPGRVVEGAANRVHVVLRGGGAIATIDATTGALVRRTDVCPAPRGIDFDSSGAVVYVACADGQFVTLREATGEIVRRVQLDSDLRDVVVSGQQQFVSRFRSAELLLVNPDGSIANRLTDPSRNVAWRTLRASAGVVMVHQVPTNGMIDVNSAHTGFGPGTSPQSAGSGAYGSSAGCGSIVQGGTTTMGSYGSSPPSALPLAVLPVDIAVAHDGSRTVVVAAGNASIRGMPQLIEQGTAPSVCFGAFGERGAPPGMLGASTITDQPNAQVIAAAFDGNDHLIAQTREPAAIYLIDEHAVIRLPGDARADLGHEIFHSNTGGNIACASCHPEGGDDGHVWQFSDVGPRRTQHLAGVAIGDGPFHWGGELHRFSDVVTQIFENRMSGPQLAADQSAALQHYLHAIPRAPAPATADPAAAERGHALFDRADVGCATCHSGARLTNDAIVDVGTGHAFKVPSLVGIAARAPYMHDGCAPTLRDRFGVCGGGDAHGHTSQLAPADVDDLVAYLQTL